MEKEYTFEVNINWVQSVPAENKKQAIQMLKDTFEQEFGFVPDDKEINDITTN